ncbi:MAG: M4 family metallopeptidase [Bacteroidales bacterium]|nr:M4 family metallopeptidase [Bacteroidales bacterium]
MKRLVYIFIILLIPGSGYSQLLQGKKASEINTHARKVWLKPSNSSVRYFDFNQDTRAKGADQLKQVLRLGDRSELRELSRFQDQEGVSHTKYQPRYKGIPIEGARVVLHSRGDMLISANGNFDEVSIKDIRPAISSVMALNQARKYIGASEYYTDGNGVKTDAPELVILPLANASFLAYKLDVFAREPFSRYFVYVDAMDGSILKKTDRLHDLNQVGEAVTLYEGTQLINTESDSYGYILRDESRGVNISTLDLNTGTNFSQAVDFRDDDNFWNEQANQDNAATNAHFAVLQSFDYYSSRFGRNSFDNQGADISSYIHFGEGVTNAFWNGNTFVFGDGDGVFYTALTTLDVVAHEYTHAVTQYSAGLEYEGESGALNESFSDIFAVAIDFYTDATTANYFLGEQFSTLGKPVRNMIDPKACKHPDTYKGAYWVTGTADNGGVHTNNGVQNHWFYLLAEGGTGINDLGHSFSVQGIGIERAAAIAYRNLTVYLTPLSDYEDARFFSIQSAADLYGACSPEVEAVTNAWYAVGVGEAFSGRVIANFSASGNLACTSPASVEFLNRSENAAEYYWTFGDGNTSSEENPLHTYENAGVYTVSLVATGLNTCNQADSISYEGLVYLENNEDPQAVFADFSISDTLPALNQAVEFSDLSANIPLVWNWSFGDGSNSEQQNPAHAFSTPGTKEIMLYVSNCSGTDTLVKTLTVLPSPAIQINMDTIKVSLVSGTMDYFNLTVSNLDSAGILDFRIELEKAQVQVAIPEYEMISTYTESLRLDPRSSASLTFQAFAVELTAGTYRSSIRILSNDIQKPELVIPVYLEVIESDQIGYNHISFIGKATIGSVLRDTSYLVNNGPGILSVDKVSIESSSFETVLENKILVPGDSVRLVILYNPIIAGPDSVDMYINCYSINHIRLKRTILAEAILPPAPQVIAEPEDRILYLGLDPEIIDLTEYFSDSQGHNLDFSASCTDAMLLDYYINEDHILVLYPASKGMGNVEVSATNIWGKQTRVNFTVTVEEEVLSVSEAEDPEPFRVYPNPATDYVFLDSYRSGHSILNLTLVDMAGHVLLTMSSAEMNAENQLRMDIGQLPSGIYNLIAEDNIQIRSFRIVKQ